MLSDQDPHTAPPTGNFPPLQMLPPFLVRVKFGFQRPHTSQCARVALMAAEEQSAHGTDCEWAGTHLIAQASSPQAPIPGGLFSKLVTSPLPPHLSYSLVFRQVPMGHKKAIVLIFILPHVIVIILQEKERYIHMMWGQT